MMIEADTIRLLRECDSGVKMGVSAIDEVLPGIHSGQLRHQLSSCRGAHQKLEREVRELLDRYHDRGKDPNPMAKGMSWLKTNMKLAVCPTDAAVADLMTDGCNMGVKSLSQYLNQYAAADEASKGIARRLIALEEQLAVELRGYL